MKKEMFEELLSSTQEMGAIMRNEKTASRITEFPEKDGSNSCYVCGDSRGNVAADIAPPTPTPTPVK
ncbi:MAG: hypothetical protein ACR2PR_03760 [Pseudohongiellaceae bacterium]